MQGNEYSLTCIFPYNDRIYGSVLIEGIMGYLKHVVSLEWRHKNEVPDSPLDWKKYDTSP